MNKPCKVLCLMDYLSYTGFATVSANIKKEVKKYFGNDIKLDIVAINYFGDAFEEEDGTYVVSAIKSASKKDDFGRLGFMKVLNDSNEYDGIFIMQDLGVILPIVSILKSIKDEKKNNKKKLFKSIYYFPIDCQLIDKLVEGLEFFDCIVTYTNYGRNEILRLRPELKGKVKVVPHGNNPKDFYPMEQDAISKFRNEYFGANANKFIITNINRNQPRKDIPTTIFSFIEAKNRWKEEGLTNEPFLYLHCHPKDPMGWDLRGLFLQTDLVENVDYKLLDIEIANKGASVEMVNNIFNASDVYVTTTLGEGWGLCLHPSSMVLTNKGCVEIKDIKIGDSVMTNSQTFNSVIDTTCRKVESLIEVKTKYGYEIKATHEHPYYSLVDGKEAYRKISELVKGDFLSIVKPTHKKDLIKKIDLMDYLNPNDWVYDKNHISNKYGYSPSNKKWSIATICKEYSTTKKVVENAISYITGKYEKTSLNAICLANYLIANGFDKSQPLKVKRNVSITNDLLWVFGWYIAEGSCEGGKRLEFSMGKDELDDAKKIAEIIKNKFGIKDVVVREFKNKCAVRVSSVALALVFKNMFGNGAYNKRIPEFLSASPKSLMPLVDGYIKGDGCIDLSRDYISFTTISPSLAYQIQSILASNNVMLSVKKRRRSIYNKYEVYNCIIPCCHLRKYMDLVRMKGKLDRESKRNHKPDFIETDTHFFVPIISIKEIKEDIEVYDLCVENSHSFVANGLVCHNTLSEAMATKTPIICPLSTSFIEMTDNGKRVYSVDNLIPYCNTIDNVIRKQCDMYEVADNMILLAKGKSGMLEDIGFTDNYNKRIDSAYNWVKSLDWKDVCKQWIQYFKETY